MSEASARCPPNSAWPPNGAEQFFLADSALDSGLEALAGTLGVHLHLLPGDTANPLEALRPLTHVLAVRPELPADYRDWPPAPEECQARDQYLAEATSYWHLLGFDLADRQKAAEFYRADALPCIAEECRRQVRRQHPALLEQRPALVTILSGSSELIELAVQVFAPRRCLILYTEQTSLARQQVQTRLQAMRNDCVIEWQPIDRRTRPGELPESVGAFVARAVREPTVIDLTPGTKLMTLALDRDVASGLRVYFMTEQRGPEIQLGSYQVVFV